MRRLGSLVVRRREGRDAGWGGVGGGFSSSKLLPAHTNGC